MAAVAAILVPAAVVVGLALWLGWVLDGVDGPDEGEAR